MREGDESPNGDGVKRGWAGNMKKVLLYGVTVDIHDIVAKVMLLLLHGHFRMAAAAIHY